MGRTGAEPVVIAEADRPLYHAALAHGSNHVMTLLGESMQVLGQIGVPHPDRVLGPLARATVDNALASGEDALTGPVARGDVATVAAHVAALRELSQDGVSAADAARSPERAAPDASGRGARGADAGEQLLAGYRALARQTAARAASSGRIDETTYRAVLAALDGEERP